MGFKMTAIPDYFVVMIDFGRAQEAVVDPEMTRRGVVSRILSGEYDAERIAWIHHIIPGCIPEDVTFDIMAECAREALDNTPRLCPSERLAALHDHARDLRKHEVL
jgi:hypothetical protein